MLVPLVVSMIFGGIHEDLSKKIYGLIHEVYIYLEWCRLGFATRSVTFGSTPRFLSSFL